MIRRAGWLGFVCLVWGLEERGSAQSGSAPSVVQPPRVLELPAIELPETVAVSEQGRIEVTVEISAEGLGSREECDYEAAVCALVQEANVTMVSTGGSHSCAIENDGEVVCWGDDTFDPLGAREPVYFGRPVEIRVCRAGSSEFADGY